MHKPLKKKYAQVKFYETRKTESQRRAVGFSRRALPALACGLNTTALFRQHVTCSVSKNRQKKQGVFVHIDENKCSKKGLTKRKRSDIIITQDQLHKIEILCNWGKRKM